jgi:hypothetical protein
MDPRRAASEFPNDNPELHDGLVWQNDSVTGHALPTLRLRQLAGSMPKVLGPSWEERPKRLVRAAPVEVAVIGRAPVVEHPPVVASVEAAVVADTPVVQIAAAAEAPSEPFEGLGWVPVADDAVREPVAEPEASVEPAALAADIIDESAPEPASAPTAYDALVAALARVALDRGATRVAAELPALLSGGRTMAGLADSPRAKSLVALGPAWRSALDGGDLAGCGDQPLDVWASELLATLLTVPGEREALRRALRRHGVAAFGMLIAA